MWRLEISPNFRIARQTRSCIFVKSALKALLCGHESAVPSGASLEFELGMKSRMRTANFSNLSFAGCSSTRGLQFIRLQDSGIHRKRDRQEESNSYVQKGGRETGLNGRANDSFVALPA